MSHPSQVGKPLKPPPTHEAGREVQGLRGAVLGASGGQLVGYLWDQAEPHRRLEVELFRPGGYYARGTADQGMEGRDHGGHPSGACFWTVPLPEPADPPPDALAAGTMLALPRSGGNVPVPWGQRQQAARRELLVQRLHWTLAGAAADIETAARDAAALERDIELGIATLSARLLHERERREAGQGVRRLLPEELVTQIFRGALGRDPGPGDFAVFCPAILDQVPLSNLIDAVIVSPEFQARPPPPEVDKFSFTARELIDHAYRAVLLRDADPDAIATYSAHLRDGLSLTSFLEVLIGAPEFRATRGLTAAGETRTMVVSNPELERLAAAMERAMLTMAIGPAIPPPAAPVKLPDPQDPANRRAVRRR